MSLPIYVDIDGTLTAADRKGARKLEGRINKVRRLIRSGKEVVVWSANGTQYAQEFCRRNSLFPLAVIGKPLFCVDDCPTVRPDWIVEPETYLDELEV